MLLSIKLYTSKTRLVSTKCVLNRFVVLVNEFVPVYSRIAAESVMGFNSRDAYVVFNYSILYFRLKRAAYSGEIKIVSRRKT